MKVNKKYYNHNIWENTKEWIESDKETFENEVINHRNQYIQRYDFKENKTTYFFDNKQESIYDWKMEVIVE